MRFILFDKNTQEYTSESRRNFRYFIALVTTNAGAPASCHPGLVECCRRLPYAA